MDWSVSLDQQGITRTHGRRVGAVDGSNWRLQERENKWIITDDQGMIVIITRDKLSALSYAKGLRK